MVKNAAKGDEHMQVSELPPLPPPPPVRGKCLTRMTRIQTARGGPTFQRN